MTGYYVFQEVQRLQKVTDEANKHSSVLERDNRRSEVQLADMAQQVGHPVLSLLVKPHCFS